MRSYLLAILAVSLLFGCFGEQQTGDPNLIPERADMYMVFTKEFYTDEDLMQLGESVIEENYQDWATEEVMDPEAVDRVIIFLDIETITGESISRGDMYFGVISFGDYNDENQRKIIEFQEKTVDFQEEKYEGITIYSATISPKDIWKEDSQYARYGSHAVGEYTTAFAFLDSRTQVVGSKVSIVKDCIDIKNGNARALDDEGMKAASKLVGENPMGLLVLRIPTSLQSEASSAPPTGPFDFSSIGKTTHFAMSFDKTGPDISMKGALLLKTENDAEKVNDMFEGLLSMYRGFSKSGSAMEKFFKGVDVSMSGNTVLFGINTDKGTLEELAGELNIPASTGQGPGFGPTARATGFSVIRPLAWNFQGSDRGRGNTMYATNTTVAFSNTAGVDLWVAVNGTGNAKTRIIRFSKPGAYQCGWFGPVEVVSSVGAKVRVEPEEGSGVVYIPAGGQIVVSGMLTGPEGQSDTTYTCGGPSGGAYRWIVNYQSVLDEYGIHHSDSGILTGKFQ